MKRLTLKQIKRAARTEVGALNVSIKKYLYLLQLTLVGVKNLPTDFLKGDYCGLCRRYCHRGHYGCPLDKRCSRGCIPEWGGMFNAYKRLKNPSQTDRPTEDYNTFLSNAAQIYVKLLKAKGTI